MTNYNATYSRLEDDYTNSPSEFIEYCKELFENRELTLNELELIVDNIPLNEADLNELYAFMDEKEAVSAERGRISIRMEEREKAKRDALRYYRAKTFIHRRIKLNTCSNRV